MDDYQGGTGCWKCNKPYPITDSQCPHCCATNPNVDLESALAEVNNKNLINHDWKFRDDSFDHEYGCEQIHYWECAKCGAKCGATREMEPGDYHDDDLG